MGIGASGVVVLSRRNIGELKTQSATKHIRETCLTAGQSSGDGEEGEGMVGVTEDEALSGSGNGKDGQLRRNERSTHRDVGSDARTAVDPEIVVASLKIAH